jgi:chemotaxis protein histidine kinase CheA
MTSTETYAETATKARETTQKSVESWKRGAKTVADQANLVTKLPSVDIAQPVERYFDFVQRSVDLNRELAVRWAELVKSLSGIARQQAETAGELVTKQVDKVADVATEQAEEAEKAAHEQAEAAEKAEKEQARQAKQAERAAQKEAHEQARAPYEGLTKAELSEQLAERGLPKTGTVDELVERLVSADSE